MRESAADGALQRRRAPGDLPVRRGGPVNRRPTQLGIAPPAQVNRGGRYAVQAPDVPVGTILRVTDREGATRYAELVLSTDVKRLFLDATGEPVEFCDWEYATRSEVNSYRLALAGSVGADEVDRCGSPAFAKTVRAMPVSERREVLTAVSEELRARGKEGKASQVAAYLEEE